jgi:hypothetical protein
VSSFDDVADAVFPSRVTALVVLSFGAALVVVGYWADRHYRRWSAEVSPLAAPRARAAAVKVSYRRKRSDVADAALMLGEILGAIETARSRHP